MKVEHSTAIQILKSSGILVYPTETFYALGCDALQSHALDALCLFKDRSDGAKTFPMLVGHVDLLDQITTYRSELMERLMHEFWPGPLTLVVPAISTLDPRIVGPGGGVAVRLTPNPIAAALSQELQSPLVSTSANLPGAPPSQTEADAETFCHGEQLSFISGGNLPGGQPSTIFSLMGDEPRVLREGAIKTSQISLVLSQELS